MNIKINAFLIDDDESTNFLNKHLLKKTYKVSDVKIFQMAKQAMDYLYKLSADDEKFPELIFLDINMPGLDGWTFVNEFNKLTLLKEQKTIIIMLSTSINPSDYERSESHPAVSEIMTKPLDPEKLNEALNKYFPD